MKEVLLVDWDSKIPNLALMKLSSWFKSRGDSVELIRVKWKRDGPKVPLRFYEVEADEAYLSCIFTWHAAYARRLEHPTAKIIRGGTGFDWGLGDGLDFSQRINLSPEIEAMEPDYDLYGDDRALGFCIRGCNRTCGFCDVWRKEGKIDPRRFKSPRQIIPDGFRKFLSLDNDIALYPNRIHDQIINECREMGVKLSITQGYDIRCVNPERAALLAENKPWDLKFKEHRLYIAWDKMSSEAAIRRNVPLLINAGFKPRQIWCYMVCSWEDFPEHGEDYYPRCDSFAQDMYRYKVLYEEFGVYPYVMVFNNRRDNHLVRQFARWVNQRGLHKNHPWEEYDRNPARSVPHLVPSKRVTAPRAEMLPMFQEVREVGEVRADDAETDLHKTGEGRRSP